MIGLVIILLLVYAAAQQPMGLAYDPEHSSLYPNEMATILKHDFNVIQTNGFMAVKTYRTIYNGVHVADYAADANLFMSLGVTLSDKNVNAQIEAAILAAKKYPALVKCIFIGNEQVNMSKNMANRIANTIEKVKDKLRGASTKIGTVQRTTEWMDAKLMENIVKQSDVLGVNAYVFFTPNMELKDAMQSLGIQMEQIQKQYPGKKTLITETGWPSQGNLVLGNTPSPKNQAIFFRTYQQTFGKGKNYPWSQYAPYENYYFQFSDTPYKNLDFEKTFGLFDSTSKIKPNLAPYMTIKGPIQSNMEETPISATYPNQEVTPSVITIAPSKVPTIVPSQTPMVDTIPTPTPVQPTASPPSNSKISDSQVDRSNLDARSAKSSIGGTTMTVLGVIIGFIVLGIAIVLAIHGRQHHLRSGVPVRDRELPQMRGSVYVLSSASLSPESTPRVSYCSL